MLGKIVLLSIKLRIVMLALLALLMGAGVYAAIRLPIDAMPDVSTVQVDILTKAPGLSPIEVERTVTFPIENAMNGVPGSIESRSVSRFGLSAVTVVFKDGTDVWRARQHVFERLKYAEAELPPTAESPVLGPASTGLGTIYRFVLKSDQHTPMQLRTILDWEIVPKLRSVPGVIEVNTFGGDLKQYQVAVDRAKLVAVKISLQDVIDALRSANVNVGGGYIERRGESYTIRGQGLLKNEVEIGDVVVRAEPGHPPVLVKHVADVQVGSALRYGVITHNGEREAVTGIVLMLMGENSREVVGAVKSRLADIERELPPGVTTAVVYDRGDFVNRTIKTVAVNLLEGVLVVTVVLAIMLGTLRGALVVAAGIPASMAIALIGMHLFGITGDLMSLGAIDFGFLVDGPVVILEGVVAATAGKALVGAARRRDYGRVAASLGEPVVYSVAIIMLVYIPLLTLEGVEGKMFRPMALTMACALFGALVYSVLFFPAALVTFVPPLQHHEGGVFGWLSERYERLLGKALRQRWAFCVVPFVFLVVVSYLFAQSGAEFVPRIFEGDAVVAMRRAPSIGLDEARKLDLMTEKVLLTFPEVKQALGQTGRAELAIDSVGNDNTDILISLKPLKEWTSASDFDDLSEKIIDKIETEVPATFASVSQPIEDLTNQLIAGSRADVSIKLYGSDLDKLVELSNIIGEKVGKVRGTGDLKIERIMGQPMITAQADRARMARYGVKVSNALNVLSAAREGVVVGDVFEEQRRFELRVLSPPSEPTAEALGQLVVDTPNGQGVPLREVLSLEEGDGPCVIKRLNRERLLRVDINLRGRDLVSWVNEARPLIEKEVPMPSGFRLAWGGQFENFERASKRLAIVVPIVIAIILGMLLAMFRNLRFSLAVFGLVPLSAAGGMVGLLVRGMPFSLPAAVGFIALGGISVLNGVVMATQAKALRLDNFPIDEAIGQGCVRSMRAVLTTGAVAGFGFLPMAISTGAGSEVQRPLATVVIAGIGFATVLSLLVFPAVLRIALDGWDPAADATSDDDEALEAVAQPGE